MESAVVRVDVVAVDVRVEPVVACGRYSSGLEVLPDTAAKARVGRFSDGLERWPDAPAARRVGSFADGNEQPGR